jgi:hypothetical protein
VVEEDVRRMSAEVATLLGAVIGFIGAAFASLIVLWGERYLRTKGNIVVKTSHWELEPGRREEDRSAICNYKLRIAVFNGMEINTGAWNVHVVLAKPGVDPINGLSEDLIRTTLEDAVDRYRTDALNFPSHNWITKDVGGQISVDLMNSQLWDSREERSCEVTLVGYLPTGEVIKHEVDPMGGVREGPYKQWSEPWYRRAVRDLFKPSRSSQSAAEGAPDPPPRSS